MELTLQSASCFLRLPAVMLRVGLSRTTIYRMIKGGHFPAPVKLGERASAWRLSDLESWGSRQVQVAV